MRWVLEHQQLSDRGIAEDRQIFSIANQDVRAEPPAHLQRAASYPTNEI